MYEHQITYSYMFLFGLCVALLSVYAFFCIVFAFLLLLIVVICHSMESLISIYVHHHGELSHVPKVEYKGGKVDFILGFDTDVFSFRDLDDFAEKYGYSPTDLVYFQTSGMSIEGGVKLLYDDNTVREMVDIHKPLGRIDLYVDHYEFDEVIDVAHESILKGSENVELGGNEENEGEDADYSDPDYNVVTESEKSESFSDDEIFVNSDDEFAEYRGNEKRVIHDMTQGVQVGNEIVTLGLMLSDESDFGSMELRSDYSSSEDENSKIGYIGPPNPKKRRIKMAGLKHGADNNVINWQVGMKFASLQEFRDTVREYGIKDRRGVQFVTNDAQRCQVCCEADCRFYIWCSKDKNSESCTIKTLFPEHNCTKPYTNKLASVKYLSKVYGDRIRKNPQWKVKEMAETIKKELEIEVPRIKILRVRKIALEGVAEALKEHYSRLRDFANEILKSNRNNTVQIRTTRLNETDSNKFKRIYVCYHALKEGWKAGCRPIIGFDGCFLKTVCGGQLLSAVGRDGNNQMFPIAYAVVESENTES